MSVDPNSLPKLPGYSFDMPRQSFGKKQTLQVRAGTMVTQAQPRVSRDSAANNKDASLTIPRAPMDMYRKGRDLAVAKAPQGNVKDTGKGTPAWIANSRVVLRFYAYWNEAVHSSAIENFRVRRCVIYFHLEDGSMHIGEPHQTNSGIPQGVFVSRRRIPKANSDSYFTPDDLAVGAEVEIYGRVFRIVDADPSTRRYYREQLGRELKEADDYPVDPFSQQAAARSSPNRNGKKSKSFGEVSTANVKATQKFLRHDGQVLRFYCMWNDPMSNNETRRYSLQYFLADDTISVTERMQANSGRDPFPSLVRRQRLPKDFNKTVASVATIGARADDDDDDDLASKFYTEDDLKIGEKINVFGRWLLLTGCDGYTKEFYLRNYDMDEADFVDLDQGDEEEKKPEMPTPAYTGFGSEEDSLGSLNTLMPKPPRKDFSKLQRFGDSNLRFLAKFANPSVEDVDRRFVVTFYMADDTVAVFEKEVRNSGFQSGKFLERKRLRNPDTGNWFAPEDFFLGAVVTVNRFVFQFIDGDEFTLKYMEANPDIFPKSDPKQVQAALRAQGLQDETLAALASEFSRLDADGNGTVDKQEFAAALQAQGYSLDEHELNTLYRRYDVNKDGKIRFTEFVQALTAA